MAGTLAVKVALSQRLPLKKDQFYNDCIKGNHFQDSKVAGSRLDCTVFVNNQSIYLMK